MKTPGGDGGSGELSGERASGGDGGRALARAGWRAELGESQSRRPHTRHRRTRARRSKARTAAPRRRRCHAEAVSARNRAALSLTRPTKGPAKRGPAETALVPTKPGRKDTKAPGSAAARNHYATARTAARRRQTLMRVIKRANGAPNERGLYSGKLGIGHSKRARSRSTGESERAR